MKDKPTTIEKKLESQDMRKKGLYTSITFKPSPEMREKILELVDETEHPASTIVYKCMEYALRKGRAQVNKKGHRFSRMRQALKELDCKVMFIAPVFFEEVADR